MAATTHESFIVLNINNGDISRYDPDTNTLSLLFNAPSSADIALTGNKLWLYNSGRLYEYDITLNPWSQTLVRTINANNFGSGLTAKNNTTLFMGGTGIWQLDLSSTNAVETKLFDLPAGYFVTGDISYIPATESFIIIYTNGSNHYLGHFTQAGQLLHRSVLNVTSGYGLYQKGSQVFLVTGDGSIFAINQNTLALTLFHTLSPIGATIFGADSVTYPIVSDSCILGPTFTLTGNSIFSSQAVSFQVNFPGSVDITTIKSYRWYLNERLVIDQKERVFTRNVNPGTYTIGTQVLTANGWSGIKSLDFQTQYDEQPT